ncbi:MAG: HigA family addiction module antitoxin [Gammaproteobacteria bacterium]|nr:HigA family addiction module antitoxin [Gammaproteobacteria bacterium]
MTIRRARRQPTSPGEILREEFLLPLGMTQKQLADHLGCDIKVVNRIVNGRTSVSAGMALKLGAAFRTTPEFWLNAQKAVDIYRASRAGVELPKPSCVLPDACLSGTDRRVGGSASAGSDRRVPT